MQVENSKMIYRGSEELARVYRGDNVIVWDPVSFPFEDQYLTLEVSGQIGQSQMSLYFYHLTGHSIDIQFSVNNGEWKSYSASTVSDKSVSVGDIVRVRGNNTTYNKTQQGTTVEERHCLLEISGAYFKIYGNIMSLVYGERFFRKRKLPTSDCFGYLFRHNDGYISEASNLCLPALQLKSRCYRYLFSGQSSLVSAPALPASTLEGYCYENMFYLCTSLVNAPALPSTELEQGCYNSMFRGCTSLENPPVLSATTLAAWCYGNMFGGCTSLVNAPVLPAAKLEDNSYREMFYGCSNLAHISCFATDISADSCTTWWVQGVSPTGTFVKSPNMSSWTTGTSGIPSGWTVVDAT